MGRLIAMPDHPCHATRLLLPWFAAGTLEARDVYAVERHLEGCAACRTELDQEHRLMDTVRANAPDVNDSWGAMRLALDRDTARGPGRRRQRRWSRPWRAMTTRRSLGWIAAAQCGALLAIGAMSTLPTPRNAAYRALGDAPAVRRGNAIVLFAPDTSEARLRHILTTAGARLVDGPTSAGAYIVELPGDGAALTRLRGERGVRLAEPIGSTEQPR